MNSEAHSPHNTRPSVLFVCVHNAGRSQMTAGFLQHLAMGKITVRSAGSAPATDLNPVAVEAMAEVGIDIRQATPQLLENAVVQSSDVVVTMGCGDACPVFPGKRYENWELNNPAGEDLPEVRKIRDQIRKHVTRLITELLPS